MKKNYQTNTASAATTSEVVSPDEVSVAMAELADAMKEGLLAMAVGAGMQVMAVMMEDNVSSLAGPKGRHDPGRGAVRHGSEAGSVTLGGRRVPVRRPRVRTADRTGEVPVPAYELFSSTDLLGPLVLEKMMGEAVDPPLRGRAGTGRHPDRGVGPVDIALGGVAPVRGRHRSGAGRADGRGPLGP